MQNRAFVKFLRYHCLGIALPCFWAKLAATGDKL